MRRVNWSDTKINAQTEYQSVKATLELAEYLKNIPDDGFINDNRTGEKLKISECRKTTLNRLLKFIVKLYYTAVKPEDKATILKKQKELEAEIDRR